MIKSIMKKSILAIFALTMCFFMTSAPAYAVDDYMHITIPPWQESSASNPEEAIVFDDGSGEKMYVGYRFIGKPPLGFSYAIKEVDSNGNYVPGGFLKFYGYTTINSYTHPLYLAGGNTEEVSTTGMLRGHIYRVQLSAVYLDNSGASSETNTYGYFYLP